MSRFNFGGPFLDEKSDFLIAKNVNFSNRNLVFDVKDHNLKEQPSTLKLQALRHLGFSSFLHKDRNGHT